MGNGERRGEPGGRGEEKLRGEGERDCALRQLGVGEGELRGEVAGVERGLSSSISQNSSLKRLNLREAAKKVIFLWPGH